MAGTPRDYHCTGYADKCQGNPATCRRKHVREEALEAQFTELLGRLKFDDEVAVRPVPVISSANTGGSPPDASVRRFRAGRSPSP